MARIIYSGLVTEIKGKMGGTVFQSNRYGFTVKNKPSHKATQSADQTRSKLIMQGMATYWNSLTQADRDAWNAWATTFPQRSSKNRSSYLNGYNLFQRWHLNNMISEPDVILAQPIDPPAVLGPIAVTITNTAGTLEVTLTQPYISADYRLLIYLSRPIPVSVSYIKSWSRLVGAPFYDGSPNTFDVTSQYVAKFGAVPAVGQIVSVDITLVQQDSAMVLYLPKQLVTVT